MLKAPVCTCGRGPALRFQHILPPPAPPAARRDDFRPGDTVSFTDQHLQQRIGTIIRINQKTASIQCDPTEGHWRVGFGLLTKIVDI